MLTLNPFIYTSSAPLPSAPAIPSIAAAQVVSYNVTPSGSNAQITPNASGSSILPDAMAPGTLNLPLAVPNVNDSAAGLAINTSNSGFMAHLIGQDLSPEAQSIVIAYNQLENFAGVKYKPSDAAKPSAPASHYTRLIAQAEKGDEAPLAGKQNISDKPVELPHLASLSGSEIFSSREGGALHPAVDLAYKTSNQRNKTYLRNSQIPATPQ